MKTVLIRPLILLTCGGLIGYSIHFWNSTGDTTPETRFTPFASNAPVEKISDEQAQKHRESRFELLTTIKDILSLPSDFDQTEALYALAGRSDADALKTLLAEAGGLPHQQNRRAAMQVLLSRYSELEPQGALSLLDKLPREEANHLVHAVYYHWAKVDINGALAAALNEANRPRQQQAARSIFQAWQYDDPETLEQIRDYFAGSVDFTYMQVELLVAQAVYSPKASLEQALQLSDQSLRWQTISRTATAWAQQNPHDAYEFALSIDNRQARDAALSAVFGAWSQTVEGAEEAFEKLTRSDLGLQEQRRLMSSIMQSLATVDPERALDLVDQLPTGQQQQAYQTILQNWARTDVRTAIAKLDDLPNPDIRQQAEFSIIYQYASQYPEEALQWARQRTGSNRQQILNTVLSQLTNSNPELALDTALSVSNRIESVQLLNAVLNRLAANDPQLAASYIDELPTGRYRQQALRTIATQWVRNDPDAALDWASTLDEGTYREAMVQIGSQLAYHDPDKAAALLPQLGDSMSQHWVPNIASAKARIDPQQAASWIEQFSDDNNYPQLVQTVATQWARRDPVAALAFVSEMPDGQRINSVSSIVSTWAGSDIQAAASWVSNNATNEEQQATVGQIARRLANEDLDSALQWAESLHSGETRDMAISTLANTYNLAPERALELVNSIASKSVRSQSISGLFYRQLHQDREVARTLLDHPDLDANMKKSLEDAFNNQNNTQPRFFQRGGIFRN